MQHRNAPLTPNSRRRLVALVEEEHLTFEAAAAASNVARSTCWEWVGRWRAATEEERRTLACLTDRPSRPRSSPAQVPDEEARMICERREKTGWSPRRLADEPDIGRPASTVHRVLRRGGCSRRPRPEPPAVIRYEWPCPGNLLHMDVKKLGRFEAPGHALTGDRRRRSRRAGWEYVHSILDDCSRLAYAEIHEDERAATVAAFTRRAFEWFEGRGDRDRAVDDRQPLQLHQEHLPGRAAGSSRGLPSEDQALHATDERQGVCLSFAVPSDRAARLPAPAV